MHKEENLNTELYKIIDLVERLNDLEDSNSANIDEEILKGSSIIKLGKVFNIEKSRTNQFGKKVSFYKQTESGEYVGFNERNYKSIIEIAQVIIQIRKINQYTDFEFVEKVICDWATQSFLNQKISEEPLNYLERRIDQEKKEYIFYFPTNALHIEANLKIGSSEIIHIDQEFIDQRKQKNDKIGPDNGINLLENRIVFKTKIVGTYDFALKQAKYLSNLNASALKIFLLNELTNPLITVFELEFNSFLSPRYTSFNETTSSKNDFAYQIDSNSGPNPTELKLKRFEEINNLGFAMISSFLQKPVLKDLESYIRELIVSAGNYSSENNYYERNVMMIAWFEGIFILPTKGKSKGLSKLKHKIIPKFISENERELVERIFIQQYKLRDRYLHNGLELRIDEDLFYKFHYLPLLLIKKMIQLSKSLSTKIELLEYFEKN